MAATMLDEDMDEWLWPDSCPELRQMESTLRCQICGEFLHGPVLLPCTHTFCSECVRRFLQSRGNNGCCPECKRPCTPGELVPNRSLEKIGVLFQQMKPKILPILEKARVPSASQATTPNPGAGKANGDGKPPERMTLVSYSVMKEKDIKKLLENIGIRTPVKNREDIIQIHKEYVLLANAQADSIHPKSAKQIREEVMRNYRARQAEKAAAGNTRKSLDAGQATVVTAEMQAGFARLQQQVKARDNKSKAPERQGDDGEDSRRSDFDDGDHDDLDSDTESGGVWRHVHAQRANLDFYIHSITNEIRVEAPAAFLERQQRLKERKDQKRNATQAKEEDDDDEPIVVGTRSAPSSQTQTSDLVAAADDDGDFEIIASPTPRPPLRSRNSTPQSASARSKADRRMSSSTPSSNGSLAGAFFSQETACSIQETSTQHIPSASLSLATQSSPLTQTNDGLASQSPGTRWECPRCTLVNESTSSQAECEACGHQYRPARKKQKLQFQSKLFQP